MPRAVYACPFVFCLYLIHHRHRVRLIGLSRLQLSGPSLSMAPSEEKSLPPSLPPSSPSSSSRP